MRTSRRLTLLTFSLMLVSAIAPSVAQDTAPCEQDERYRALDFWVGEWQVVDSAGQTVGTNRIEKSQRGCVIEERWISAGGGTGQSMNYFDPAEGVWRQNWVDQGGGVVHYQGGVDGGTLRFAGRHIRRDGTVTMARVVLAPIEGGRLHHLIEHSQDGGSSWSTYFDGTYIPVGEAESVAAATATGAASEPEAVEEAAAADPPATMAPGVEAAKEAVVAAPTPEPAKPVAVAPDVARPEPTSVAQPQAARQADEEGSDVKAVTRELQREEIPETQAPALVMASPMVLEVTPGNIDDYPEGTAWHTRETAGFICDEVTVKRVGVGHKSRRGNVNLIVSALLHTTRRQKKVDLLLEVVAGAQTVASEELKGIRLGLNIPAHGKEGLVSIAEMSVSREQFDALFGGDSRPILRLTMSCPSLD